MSERTPPVKQGEILYNVLITDTGNAGTGFFKIDDRFVVMVNDSTEGLWYSIRITKVLPNMAFAEIVEDDY